MLDYQKKTKKTHKFGKGYTPNCFEKTLYKN